MKITETRITIVEETNRLRAYANVVFDNCFMVRGLKVIEGERGLFVAMPSIKKGRDRKPQDIAHPINNETRVEIEGIVLDAYEDELNRKDDGQDIQEEEIQYGR